MIKTFETETCCYLKIKRVGEKTEYHDCRNSDASELMNITFCIQIEINMMPVIIMGVDKQIANAFRR